MQRLLITISIFTLVCLFAVCSFRYRNGVDVLAAPQVAPSQPHASHMRTSKSERPQPVAPDDFYQTIIDNNIFRPLNWKPPQREPAYTLLGTAIATKGRTATAYIQERHSEHLHIVKVGDPLGDATVQKITPKRVTLTTQKGSTTHLSLSSNIFLNPKHTRARRSDAPLPQPQNRTPTATSQKGTTPETALQRRHADGLERLKKRATELRAERTRMQQRLRYLQQR